MRFLKLILKISLLLIFPLAIQVAMVSIFAILGVGDTFVESNLLFLLLISNAMTCIVLFAMTKVMRRSIREDYRLFSVTYKQLSLAIGIGFSAMFVSLGISGFFKLQSLDPEAAQSLESLVNAPLWLSLLAVGIIAPIGEELLFRGALLRLLRINLPTAWAVVLQGLLFGIYHMNLVQAPPTAVLGIILGVVVMLTHSIWPAIAIHIVNNTLAILLSQIEPESLEGTTMPPEPSPLYFLIVGSMALFFVLIMLKQLKNQQSIDPILKNHNPLNASE